MSVAHEDHVDSGYLLCNRNGFVFMRHLSRTNFTSSQILTQPHVHSHDYDVNLLFCSQHVYPFPCLRNGIVKFETGIVGWVVPVGNAWRCESEYSNFHAGDIANQVRLVMWLAGFGL